MAYARYRPRYPDVLFDRLATMAPATDRAWDCATGNGQAADGLARHFRRVVGTDISVPQLARAQSLPNVSYLAAAAESTPLAPASVDLVAVAQAVHWFDNPRFYDEVRRVARPGALLAVWTYPLLRISDAMDPILHRFMLETLGPYWPPGRELVVARYETLSFPLAEEPATKLEDLELDVEWRLEDLLGYFSSASAVARYRRQQGVDPVAEVRALLAPLWGDAEHRHRVWWPLHFRLARLSG